MRLCLFVTRGGYHAGGWRMPGSRVEEILTLGLVRDIAQQAERAKLDAVFFADLLHLGSVWGRRPNGYELEPLTTIAALAAVTERIGLVATVSSGFTEPYNLARYFASIDHLSAGRAGWNVVTSAKGEENFGGELRAHDDRYDQADEYMEVVTALWDSWSDDAIVNDRGADYWARPERIRPVDHKGRHYRVAGPLNVPRSPQGRPVLFQAGSSAKGMGFAAAHADAIFTLQPELRSAQRFYAEVKHLVKGMGRDPDVVKVMPGLMPIIGPTETEALRISEQLADLVAPDVGRAALEAALGQTDLGDLDLDETIPPDRLVDPRQFERGRARYELFYKLAVDEQCTVRGLIKTAAGTMGHLTMVGTAEQVAEQMVQWLEHGACDGFNLQMPYLPGGLDAITEELVPVLQARGYARTEYAGRTLRDHFGLSRPASSVRVEETTSA